MESTYHPRSRQPRYPLREQDHDPHHDEELDMELESISRVQGGSSLQVSNHDYPFSNPLLTHKMHNIVHLVEGIPLTIPYKSPRKEDDCNPHNAKQRKLDIEEFTTTTNPNKLQEVECTQSCARQKIPRIESITQMWLRFCIHKAKATQQGSRIVKEKCIDERIPHHGHTT